MSRHSYDAYRKAVVTGGANRQLLLLFDAMLDHLRLAAGLLTQDDAPPRELSRHLGKVRRILSELEKAVRLDSWEGASALVVLYRYVNLRLSAARPSSDSIQEAIDTLARLRRTWVEAGRQGATASSLPPRSTRA